MNAIEAQVKELRELSEAYFCRGDAYIGTSDILRDAANVIEALYSKLKEYKALEEQGKLLKLPCKAGDTLYFPYIDITMKEEVISEEKVAEIGLYYRVGNGELSSCSEIGDIIFAINEQAKNALKYMEV